MATRKKKEPESATPFNEITATDDDERALVHVKKFHHHGILGVLKAGQVYRGSAKHFRQIAADFPDVLEFVDEDKAAKILAENKKKAEAEIKAAERREAKRVEDRIASTGRAKEV